MGHLEKRDLKKVNEGHHVLLAVNPSRNMVRKGARVVLMEKETRSSRKREKLRYILIFQVMINIYGKT